MAALCGFATTTPRCTRSSSSGSPRLRWRRDEPNRPLAAPETTLGGRWSSCDSAALDEQEEVTRRRPALCRPPPCYLRRKEDAMKAVEAAKILEFFRSLPPDAYITRVERARFRDQEITATETMAVRHAIDETMANLSRPGRVALNFGRYWRDPVPPS